MLIVYVHPTWLSSVHHWSIGLQEEGAVGGREENSFTTNGHQTTNILQSLREYRRREFKPNHTVSQY